MFNAKIRFLREHTFYASFNVCFLISGKGKDGNKRSRRWNAYPARQSFFGKTPVYLFLSLPKKMIILGVSLKQRPRYLVRQSINKGANGLVGKAGVNLPGTLGRKLYRGGQGFLFKSQGFLKLRQRLIRAMIQSRTVLGGGYRTAIPTGFPLHFTKVRRKACRIQRGPCVASHLRRKQEVAGFSAGQGKYKVGLRGTRGKIHANELQRGPMTGGKPCCHRLLRCAGKKYRLFGSEFHAPQVHDIRQPGVFTRKGKSGQRRSCPAREAAPATPEGKLGVP